MLLEVGVLTVPLGLVKPFSVMGLTRLAVSGVTRQLLVEPLFKRLFPARSGMVFPLRPLLSQPLFLLQSVGWVLPPVVEALL